MGDNALNSDEFDSVFELIICILFMAFGILATSFMLKDMVANVEISGTPDKIEITSSTHYAEDPFWFTGYQAYMFSWHMDELSYESLSYVGGTIAPWGQSAARLDGTDNKHVTLCVLQPDGSVMPQFLVWRNQMITGAGNGATSSVKSTLASIVPSSNLRNLYTGNVHSGGQTLLFHLELTDAYNNNNNLGNNVNYGGKTYKWVLAPYYH